MLGAILVAGGANFLLGLGSSSYYVDEILSVSVADSPLDRLLRSSGHGEISPPGWFALLHEWAARLGSSRHEWLMRLPAAACAVGLVAVVYWLVRLLGLSRRFALGGAVLCALSPFELEYAQRAQGYAAVGLAVALAVSAAIAAQQAAGRRRSGWLALSLLAAIAGLMCNYTAALIVAPLCLWLLTRGPLPRRWRWGYTAVCLATAAALVPLLITQHAAHPQRGVGASAALNASTLQNMLELPFGGRVAPLRLAGVLITLVALAVAVGAERRRGGGFGARRLVLGLAIGAPAALILLSAVGGHFFGLLMLNRYGAVAVPFLITSLVLAAAALPRGPAAVLAVGVGVVLLSGTVANHRASSYYLDARDAAAYVRAHAAPGDAVLEPPYPWYQVPLDYYGLAALHPVSSTAAFGALLLGHRRRIWIVSAVPSGTREANVVTLTEGLVRRFGYRPVAARVFPSTAPLGSVLVVPAALPR